MFLTQLATRLESYTRTVAIEPFNFCAELVFSQSWRYQIQLSLIPDSQPLSSFPPPTDQGLPLILRPSIMANSLPPLTQVTP